MISYENKWYLITDIYYQLYKFRLGATVDIDELEQKIDDVIDDVEDNKIKNISIKEKEIIISMMFGIKSYINSSDLKIGKIYDLRSSYKISEKLHRDNKELEASFGFYLTKLIIAVYFENSFWIKNVFGYDGNVSESLLNLQNIANKDNYYSIESNLALVEYYEKILLDHRTSSTYTKRLNQNYPSSKYFKFLYAEDLYHTGKIENAYKLFQDVNNHILNNYYPFEYLSLIYEIKCMFLLDKKHQVEDLINYTKQIHDGYLLEELLKWKSSIKRRKDIIYRFEKLNFRDVKDLVKNEHDKKLTMEVLFDHGYFEVLLILISIDDDPDSILMNFRAAMVLGKYETARGLYDVLESKFEEFLDNHPDNGRIVILKNILDNSL